MTPLLKFFFTVSYVVLAAFVGAFADSMPKGKVMFITNAIKIVGCALMFFFDDFASLGISPHAVVLAPTPWSAWAPRPTRRPSTASSPRCCRRGSW